MSVWDGQLNPHRTWSTVLGGTAGLAALVPGWGTVTAVGLTLERLRYDHVGVLDQWVASRTGLSEGVVRLARVLPTLPAYPPGVLDLLPDRDVVLPGPSLGTLVDGACGRVATHRLR